MRPLIMWTLSTIAILTGGLCVAIGGAGVFASDRAQSAFLAFPRNRQAAALLTLINVLWVTWLLHITPLGRFEGLKNLLFVLSPLTLFAVIRYLDELLAPRMLGGLLLLAAVPVLDIARWHDSGLRLVLTTFTYIWIVWAMVLMLSPYRFRHTVQWSFRGSVRVPFYGALLGLGLLLLALAVTVY